MASSPGEDVLAAQHASLDAADAFASAWSVALAEASAAAGGDDDGRSALRAAWGGRGKGGRGRARRTFQPRDIVVDSVDLEYVNDASVTGEGRGGSKALLSDAYLKLLPGRVYALVGRNGGKTGALLSSKEASDLTEIFRPENITGVGLSQSKRALPDLSPRWLLRK
ncbi:hypothetical protein ACHAWF_010921 [Thalassiosira exigua]